MNGIMANGLIVNDIGNSIGNSIAVNRFIMEVFS